MEKLQPTADCIVARLVPSWGSIVSLLFKATKPYEHYYDEHGEEVPYGAIESWTDVELPPESEDERIRNYFIWIVKNVLDNIQGLKLSKEQTRELIENYAGIKVSDMLAYLEKQKEPADGDFARGYDCGYECCLHSHGAEWFEKQKEQKPLMSDGEIEDRKRDIVAAIRKYYRADYAKYLTSFLMGLSPEDNSDDEYGQEMLGIAYKLMYEHIPENLRTQEFWDSLKFMREYTGRVAIIHSYEHPAEWSDNFEENIRNLLHEKLKWTSDDGAMSSTVFIDDKTLKDIISGIWFYVGKEALKYPNKQLNVEQKPAEWSEEDKKNFYWISTRIQQANMTPEYSAKVYEILSWLESLRPQSHWKPSEEQMEALQRAVNKLAKTDVADSVRLSIISDNLKKMM